jgi:hypothetical protein
MCVCALTQWRTPIRPNLDLKYKCVLTLRSIPPILPNLKLKIQALGEGYQQSTLVFSIWLYFVPSLLPFQYSRLRNPIESLLFTAHPGLYYKTFYGRNLWISVIA